MLGERRSNSLFAPAAPAEPERKPEQAEVHDISFEERTGRSLFAEAATAPRASELFFAPQEKGVTFAEALSQVQSYLSETYAIVPFQFQRRMHVSVQRDCDRGMAQDFGQRFDLKADLNGTCRKCVAKCMKMHPLQAACLRVLLQSILQYPWFHECVRSSQNICG